jgi:uncharacterized glyoxalase superfamily protein PhnB
MPAIGEIAITRSASYFPVPDVVSIGSYYRDVLGFRCEYSAGEPPEFAIYSRDSAAVMFRRVRDATLLRPNESQGGTWDVFCWVSGLDALYRELEQKGATIVYPPVAQPYGTREFAIRDPLGRVWGFGERAAGDDATAQADGS